MDNLYVSHIIFSKESFFLQMSCFLQKQNKTNKKNKQKQNKNKNKKKKQ